MMLRSISIYPKSSFFLVGFEAQEENKTYSFARILPHPSVLARLAKECAEHYLCLVEIEKDVIPIPSSNNIINEFMGDAEYDLVKELMRTCDIPDILSETVIDFDDFDINSSRFETVDGDAKVVVDTPIARLVNIELPELAGDPCCPTVFDLLFRRIGVSIEGTAEDLVEYVEKRLETTVYARITDAASGTIYDSGYGNRIASYAKGDAGISITYNKFSDELAWAFAMIRPIRTSTGYKPRYSAGVVIKAVAEEPAVYAESFGGEAWYAKRVWRPKPKPPFGASARGGRHLGVPFMALALPFSDVSYDFQCCARPLGNCEGCKCENCGVYTLVEIKPIS